MSYAPAAHCDICGEPKRQTNHWFQARVSAERILIEPFDPKSKAVKHLCGEGCVGKLVSAELARLGARPVAADEPIEFPISLNDDSAAPEVANACEQSEGRLNRI